MASPGRAPSPELNLNPQLNPAPLVNVVPVRPVNREGAGSNLMRIAEALGGLSGSIGQFGRSMAASRDRAQAEGDKAAVQFAKINAFVPPEQIPNQPGYDPTKEPIQVLIGQNTATQIGADMQRMVMEEYDPETDGDLQTYLVGRLKAVQAELPPAAQAGFGSTIDAKVNDTLKWYQGMQTDKQWEAVKQNTFTHFVSTLNDQFKDLPPEERVQKMKEFGLDKYRLLKFVDGKGANDLLMQSVDYFAKAGDKDMARALATLRRGKDGEVPSIYDMPEYRDKIDKAYAEADLVWRRNNQNIEGDFLNQEQELVKTGDLNKLTELYNSDTAARLYPDLISRGEKLRSAKEKLQKNILDNTVTAQKEETDVRFEGTVLQNFDTANGSQVYEDPKIVTKDGKEYTFPGQKRAQEVLDRSVKDRYQKAADDPEAVAQVDKDLARKAAVSPFKISEWENLYGGVMNSSVAASLREGKVPPNVKRAYELWKNTADNPRLRRAHMGEGAAKVDDFFSAVDVFREGGADLDSAFVAANRAVDNKDATIGRISEEAYGINSNQYGLRDMPIDLQKRIIDRASVYLGAGTLNQSKAVEKSIKDFEDETVILDGFGSRPSYIKAPSKQTDKEQYGQTITNFVTRQIETFGAKQEPPLSLDRVNIIDNGDGTFMLQQDDGDPVPAFFTHRGGAKGKGVMFFTFEDIQKQAQADAQATQDSTLKDAGEVDRLRSGEPIDPKGRSAIGALKDTLFGESKPKEDTSILKGLTGNPEEAYGATTGDDLRKLSDFRLKEVYMLSREGKLKSSGFVTDRSVKDEWNTRVRKAAKEAGYSMNQVQAAMTRWNLDDEMEALKRLKANKAPTK